MKKIILAILIAVCLGGIGYLGYVIFQAKNIESVEISGNIQTLYVVGDELDFGDAKLKVTYKNGNIRMVDLDKDSVKVTMFSTSLEAHGTMKITYKSEVIEKDYNVIKKGYYYLQEKTITNSVGTVLPNTFTIENTTQVIYIGSNNVIKYYNYASGKWYLNDGAYDKSYKYSINGDTMKVSTGVNSSLDIVANYNSNGIMTLSSIEMTKSANDEDLVTRKEERIYGYYNTSELVVNTVSVDYSKVTTTNYNGKDVLTFKVGDFLETSTNKNLLLKVRYVDQDLSFIREAYVYVPNEIVGTELRTGNVTSGGVNTAYCFYESKEFYFYYIVENA